MQKYCSYCYVAVAIYLNINHSLLQLKNEARILSAISSRKHCKPVKYPWIFMLCFVKTDVSKWGWIIILNPCWEWFIYDSKLNLYIFLSYLSSLFIIKYSLNLRTAGWSGPDSPFAHLSHKVEVRMRTVYLYVRFWNTKVITKFSYWPIFGFQNVLLFLRIVYTAYLSRHTILHGPST